MMVCAVYLLNLCMAGMVLVTDYEGTRYYYKLQFYRDRLPNGVRIEQLREMIMDAQFSYK